MKPVLVVEASSLSFSGTYKKVSGIEYVHSQYPVIRIKKIKSTLSNSILFLYSATLLDLTDMWRVLNAFRCIYSSSCLHGVYQCVDNKFKSIRLTVMV